MNSKSSKTIWYISGGMVLLFLCVGVFVVNALIGDDGQKRKRQIQMITLIKPPPPPKIKEEPPPPEIKKEEVVQEIPEAPEEKMDDVAESDVPEGEDLGLDADGSAGSDSFGLKAKKGGRALIGSGKKGASRMYAWYTRIMTDEIWKMVKKRLDENGGIPEGKVEAVVKVELDSRGKIVRFLITKPSGHLEMDQAVRNALKVASISEPPPEGMGKAMRIRITSQG